MPSCHVAHLEGCELQDKRFGSCTQTSLHQVQCSSPEQNPEQKHFSACKTCRSQNCEAETDMLPPVSSRILPHYLLVMHA